MTMTKLATVICSLFFLGAAWSQDLSVAPSEWQELTSVDGITFYGRTEQCDFPGDELASSFALVRIVNNTSEEKVVNYHLALQYQEGCSGCAQTTEFDTAITVPANTTVEGACGNTTRELSRIIYNPNLDGGWHYESMQIVNPVIR